jgi:hypothetical protein
MDVNGLFPPQPRGDSGLDPEVIDRWDPVSGNFLGYLGVPVSIEVDPVRTDRLAITMDQFRAYPGGFKTEVVAVARILCESPIDVIARTTAGEPLAVGMASTAISPKTRRYVLARDGGICTVDGCGSTYRLQPHHLTERRDGGNNHHSNLTSLCWYHHHVVVHGRGFRIDPDSPPRRRRFHPPDRTGSDPPI